MSDGSQIDHTAFQDGVLCADWMEAEMRKRADRVKETAEAIAPYDEHDTDHYRDHFSVGSGIQTDTAGRHAGTKRAYGEVANDHDAAFQIEFGTDDTPRHRTLGVALDAAG